MRPYSTWESEESKVVHIIVAEESVILLLVTALMAWGVKVVKVKSELIARLPAASMDLTR